METAIKHFDEKKCEAGRKEIFNGVSKLYTLTELLEYSGKSDADISLLGISRILLDITEGISKALDTVNEQTDLIIKEVHSV